MDRYTIVFSLSVAQDDTAIISSAGVRGRSVNGVAVARVDALLDAVRLRAVVCV